jgi:hypothetical protein
MRIRRRNWIIKRIALGFAVAALVAPAAAQARVDEGINGQPNKASEGYVPFVTDFPSYEASQAVKGGPQMRISGPTTDSYNLIEVVRTQPRSTQHGYLLRRDGNAVETNPVLRSSDLIENVRLAPRGSGEVVASSGFDWGAAGIGAGLVAALLVLGGIAVRTARKLGEPQTA